MRILGIDPGTAITGFGVIELENGKYRVLDYGCIKTEKHLPLQERLMQIGKDLGKLIKLWKPENAAVEELFFAKNVKTALSVAHARGVIIKTFAENKIPLAEYKPNQVKNTICGDGKALKPQIQKMICILLKLTETPKPDDAADALAIALCHAFHQRLAERVATSRLQAGL